MSTRFYRNPDGTGLCGRSALSGSSRRGLAIRVVAFRASHPAKPPSRQRRFVQRFLNSPLQRRRDLPFLGTGLFYARRYPAAFPVPPLFLCSGIRELEQPRKQGEH